MDHQDYDLEKEVKMEKRLLWDLLLEAYPKEGLSIEKVGTVVCVYDILSGIRVHVLTFQHEL